jgi:hypothetical protein
VTSRPPGVVRLLRTRVDDDYRGPRRVIARLRGTPRISVQCSQGAYRDRSLLIRRSPLLLTSLEPPYILTTAMTSLVDVEPTSPRSASGAQERGGGAGRSADPHHGPQAGRHEGPVADPERVDRAGEGLGIERSSCGGLTQPAPTRSTLWTNSPGDGRLTNLVDHWLAASADLGWPRPRGAAMPRLSVDSPGQYVIPLRALDGTAVAPLAERVKRDP